MFQIYLNRQLLNEPAQESDEDNRRHSPRFNVSQQNIMALSSTDILKVLDISQKGFSCQVAPSAAANCQEGDSYDASIKYLGEKIKLTLKVAWKAETQLGFRLVSASDEALAFFQRLLTPMEIASSLKKKPNSLDARNHQGKTWYHGDRDTDFILWWDSEGELEAWQMFTSSLMVEWHQDGGYRTAQVIHQEDSQEGSSDEEQLCHDPQVDQNKIKFVTDILMAINNEDSHKILKTLLEEPWDSGYENTEIESGPN